jgi:hypothetical protein
MAHGRILHNQHSAATCAIDEAENRGSTGRFNRVRGRDSERQVYSASAALGGPCTSRWRVAEWLKRVAPQPTAPIGTKSLHCLSESWHAKISGEMASLRLALAGLMLLGTGCNQDKIARLEKENKAMRAELEQQKQLVDLDTQAKCANAAKQFQRDEFPADATTILLDQHNHFNKMMGKCFVLIEWHYSIGRSGSWQNVIKLFDVFQRDEYGDLSEITSVSFAPNYTTDKRLYSCVVYGSKCKSIEEFNQLTARFMNDVPVDKVTNTAETPTKP